MITGKIITRQAVIVLEVGGSRQPTRQVRCVIDTGYNGHLTLPGHLVSSLQLPFGGYRRGTLADGSVVVLEAYLATIGWHGKQTEILVSQTAGAPLVGMALIHGSRLTVDVIERGDVTLEELTNRP